LLLSWLDIVSLILSFFPPFNTHTKYSPVKIVLHVFPFIQPWQVASVAFLLAIYIFLKEMKELLYFSVKTFFHSILSIFFRHVEIVGVQNIPTFGPCIFSVNHANQFVDAVMLVCTCQRQASYLMAETSYKRRVIGDLAWALGVVPVKRPQDSAIKGTGSVSITLVEKNPEEQENDDAFQEDYGGGIALDDNNKSYVANGINTAFTKELQAGDKIRPPGTPAALKIKEIVNDTTLIIDGRMLPDDFETFKDPKPFDILKRVDQKQVYEKVLEKLASGGAIGIFPEGGSHDRTSLLPLKVGVALIAYSALEKDGINVPVVPVGLNYFKAHRWRGRAVVEVRIVCFCFNCYSCNSLLTDSNDFSLANLFLSTHRHWVTTKQVVPSVERCAMSSWTGSKIA